MEILTVLGMLLLLLVISVGSLLRYWFIRGRLRGMQEAAAETIRGIHSHFEVEGQLPPGVSKTLEKLKTAAGSLSHHKQLELRHAQLWMFGDAIGSACWGKGYRAGKLAMAPRDGRLLVELSPNQLLQLNRLAHVGFQHMMPNYRGFETHRFSGEDDARNGARAVERLEVSIPAMHRQRSSGPDRELVVPAQIGRSVFVCPNRTNGSGNRVTEDREDSRHLLG